MSSLKDQRVLVIGGSSGIGLATALQAAAAGAHVTIASRDRAKLDAALAEIGPGATAAVLDTGDEAAVIDFFAVRDPFDHVVVSAAQTATGPVRGLSMEDAKAAMDSKFWGAYRVARAARITEHGSLTLVSGYLGVRPSAVSVLQGAMNAALDGLARGLALEFAPIRVNSVSPGTIATPLWNKLGAEKRDALFGGLAQRLPARRVGQADDIANAILFLLATSFATGSTVRVDGGAAIA